MKTPEYRKIKTRKVHACAHCDTAIPIGSAQFLEFKGPTYDDNDKQNGIDYYREWIHQECLDKICSDMELINPLPF